MEAYKNLSLEDMKGEVWKDIEGFEGMYQVSNMGRIKSLNRVQKSYNGKCLCDLTVKSRILKQTFTRKVYLHVCLAKNGICKTERVHRIVAKAFLPNPDNKPSVDHKNTITTDNRVENLRWATQKEQINNNNITYERVMKASSKNGKKYIYSAVESIKLRVRCITTGKEFDSIADASRYYNATRNRISLCCKGKAKTTGRLPDGTKLEWEYID